jgi:ubiquinone/menaquinone biosynthesis C-methylase UbiE
MNYLAENLKRREWLEKDYQRISESFQAVSNILMYLPNATTSILDIGTGRGHVTNLLNYAGKNCIGIDMCLENTNPRVIKDEQVIKPFAIADLYHLPFPDNSFDLVFEHFAFSDLIEFQGLSREDLIPAIKEIYRVLKPSTISDGHKPAGFFYGDFKHDSRILEEKYGIGFAPCFELDEFRGIPIKILSYMYYKESEIKKK